MDAVLLAAGEGKRLAQLTYHQPKPLIKLLGKPLLAHVLERLRVAGVRRVIIVTGHKHKQIEKFIAQQRDWDFEIITVLNGDYERGNGDSLLCVECLVKDRFLLAMADHLVEPSIYLKAAAHEGLGLCVDTRYKFHVSRGTFQRANVLKCRDVKGLSSEQLAEATKVWIERGRITKIGKNLKAWNGIDVGVFSMTPLVFEALHSLEHKKMLTLTEAVSRLIERGEEIKALDVSGMFWCDIDTPFDLKLAEARLRCKQ